MMEAIAKKYQQAFKLRTPFKFPIYSKLNDTYVIYKYDPMDETTPILKIEEIDYEMKQFDILKQTIVERKIFNVTKSTFNPKKNKLIIDSLIKLELDPNLFTFIYNAETQSYKVLKKHTCSTNDTTQRFPAIYHHLYQHFGMLVPNTSMRNKVLQNAYFECDADKQKQLVVCEDSTIFNQVTLECD